VALLRGSVRGTGIARYWPYSAAAHPTELAAEEVAPYSALMAASQRAGSTRLLSDPPASLPSRRAALILQPGPAALTGALDSILAALVHRK
jgi:hypothetical protein